MLKTLTGQHLREWITDVLADDLPPLHSFVGGLQRDLDAVTAGLTLPWSSGLVEYHAILGEHELAEQRFREALDIEDAEPGSAHAFYASFLLDRHRHDEALAMIAAARKRQPEDPDVFAVIGEALAEHGYPKQAAHWFTAGLVEQLGHLVDVDLNDLRHIFDLATL